MAKNQQAMMMGLSRTIHPPVTFEPVSVRLLIVSRRYLRARKFVPKDAFAQFKDTEIWRKENKLDALYENIDIHDYQEARSVVSLPYPFASCPRALLKPAVPSMDRAT